MPGSAIEHDFTSQVRKVRLSAIRPSHTNPRGPVDERDPSFIRLVNSIDNVGLLVPLVVRELGQPEGDVRYELVDGERRYWACRKLARPEVPAHILKGPVRP